jgi:hypothetical protein
MGGAAGRPPDDVRLKPVCRRVTSRVEDARHELPRTICWRGVEIGQGRSKSFFQRSLTDVEDYDEVGGGPPPRAARSTIGTGRSANCMLGSIQLNRCGGSRRNCSRRGRRAEARLARRTIREQRPWLVKMARLYRAMAGTSMAWLVVPLQLEASPPRRGLGACKISQLLDRQEASRFCKGRELEHWLRAKRDRRTPIRRTIRTPSRGCRIERLIHGS